MSTEDIAQEVELTDWRRRNELRKPQPVYQPGDVGYGPETCQDEDCGDTLPDVRRAYGSKFCTACAERNEKFRRHYAN